ncbi:MAG: asparagine synthase (glutamine-hydrolyzing) [bacterium]|nr:asparagine synthase (glutamine-hydrolyzing) [bacterium]
MCGIAGYISLKGQSHGHIVESMTHSIKHRGPDGFGFKSIDNVSIGHRRLSIIDLETGAQPMSNASETVWITYNGELYNYGELKNELEKSGIRFKTNSDTEVIVYSYQTWGVSCLQKFRGMFAFGIIDLNKRQIFLARDHFGIKPIYIYQDVASIAFGSEMQQFNLVPSFNKQINYSALDDYLWLQYIPAPKTIFKHVQNLKPAHYCTISFEGIISEQKEYWNVNFAKKENKTKGEWLEATSAAINEAVKVHLVSDVPFGAFLSGGIDSTTVVKYMSANLPQPVKTFSIGFEEEEYNELSYALIASKKYQTEHYTEIVRPDALGILPDLVRHYGEPFGDSSCIPTYYVCKLAKQHVTMVLSGDGGDECFGGYPSYSAWMRNIDLITDRSLKGRLKAVLNPGASARKELDEWMQIIQCLNLDWRNKIWNKEINKGGRIEESIFASLYKQTSKMGYANKVQYMDMKTYMPFDILPKVDVASMMHGLEVRTPLIDRKVWEYAAGIPEEMLINKTSGNWEGKLLLKQLLEKDFRSDFIYRPKKGFAVPLSKWFSSNGELSQVIQEKVLAKDSLINTIFDVEVVAQIYRENNLDAVWLLLFLEEWLNQFNN